MMAVRRLVPVALVFMFGACGVPQSTDDDAGGLGGASTTGKGGSVGTGGVTASGGATGTGGGTTGTTGAGGATGSGGATGTDGGAAGVGGRRVMGTGGAMGMGGATGVAGAPGGGGSSGTTCGVSPVTPNASQQAKNLLCYLYSIKGNHVLSGQQEANWNANPTDIAWYTSNGLKFPAILASDFLYRSSNSCTSVTTSTTRAIAYWNAGGLTMFRYHMGLPGAGLTCANDCFSGANCAEPTTHPDAAFFNSVITPGTPENTSLNAKLDYVAVQIGAMKAANVPVILAIFHETQSNGWFWWAENSTGPQFASLWKYTFNYLNNTKGLTNIVWLMPFSGSPNAGYYPGKTYVDIGGPDEYARPANLLTFNASGNYNPAASIFGNTMPIALHETGSALQPDSMFPSAATPWIMWNVWATYENTVIGGFAYNTAASMRTAYDSQYTITRDEIPSLK
jgi:hypothetical protein